MKRGRVTEWPKVLAWKASVSAMAPWVRIPSLPQMTLKQLQKQVDKWVNRFTEGYWKPHEILARLTEETGELAREINNLYGPKKKKKTESVNELGDEIADVIFTLACLANSKNIDLDKSFQKMMDKLNKRDKNRWEKKK